jgi:hypothetical protein
VNCSAPRTDWDFQERDKQGAMNAGTILTAVRSQSLFMVGGKSAHRFFSKFSGNSA